MKKYFVIGNPINHSLSPKLQNWWLKENNINATYDKIKLEDLFKKGASAICPNEVSMPSKKKLISTVCD